VAYAWIAVLISQNALVLRFSVSNVEMFIASFSSYISILEAQNWKLLTNVVTQQPCSFRDPIHENAMENRGKGLRFVISVVNIYTYIHLLI